MDIEIDIQLESGYILAKYRGPDSPEISRQIIQEIVDACERLGCFRVLMISYLENPLSATENFDLADMFREVGFTPQHRLAWVDQNPETRESTAFAETVLYNRGIMARLFDDVDRASQWLLAT